MEAQRFWKSMTYSAQPPGLASGSECPRNPAAWSPVESFIQSSGCFSTRLHLQGTVIRFCPLPKNPFTDWKMKPRGGYPETGAKQSYPGGAPQRSPSVSKIFFPKMVGTIKSYFSKQIWGWVHDSVGKAQAWCLQSTGHQRPQKLGVQQGQEKISHPQGKVTSQTSWEDLGPERDPASGHTVESDGGTHVHVHTHTWACIQHTCALHTTKTIKFIHRLLGHRNPYW